MPFTEPQLNVIVTIIEELNEKVNRIITVRDQIVGLTNEVHNGFSDNAELMAVVAAAKVRAKTAADELSVLLS
jgi:hypothetical protein